MLDVPFRVLIFASGWFSDASHILLQARVPNPPEEECMMQRKLATSENQDSERYLTLLLNMTASCNNLQAVN